MTGIRLGPNSKTGVLIIRNLSIEIQERLPSNNGGRKVVMGLQVSDNNLEALWQSLKVEDMSENFLVFIPLFQ